MPRAKKTDDVKEVKPKKTAVRKAVKVADDPFYTEQYEVVHRESLNFFDPSDNSNKYYIAEVHVNAKGEARYYFNHARVGNKGNPQAEPAASVAAAKTKFDSKVREKKRKGYLSVDLATVGVGSEVGRNKVNAEGLAGVVDVSQLDQKSALPDKVANFVRQIYDEANQAVAYSISGEVKADISAPLGNLGINGINAGRQLLAQISRNLKYGDKAAVKQASVEFYRNIPRKLAHNLRKDDSWILSTQEKIASELDILDLYEDTLRMMPVMGASGVDAKYMALGADIALVTDPSIIYEVERKIATTHARNHHYKLKVRNVYAVRQHNAPVFDPSCGNVQLLFHGSRSANLVGILSSHLKLPNSLSSDVPRAGAMFGPGIYFADQCTKSFNYAAGSWVGRRNKYDTAFLMLCDVALGNIHKTESSYYYTSPPKGKHSVMGCEGRQLYNNEYIVYRENQVAIRYLVELEQSR